jgi:regulator of sirC expression with transglutaminase-like and TPR domain
MIPASEIRSKLFRKQTAVSSLASTFLQTTSELQIFIRYLLDIKIAAFQADDWQKLLATFDALLFVSPQRAVERRERGLLLYHLGFQKEALADLHSFMQGESAEAQRLRKAVEQIRSRPGMTPLPPEPPTPDPEPPPSYA